MKQVKKEEIIKFIEPNIEEFHNKRLQRLSALNLKLLLKRKNPYLFKAKNINKSQDLVEVLLTAYLSSQEEGIFGAFLEKLAIFICEKAYNGRKSSAEGIDLEFKKNNSLYLISIKSGPNWGNSQQIKRMIDNFRKARRILSGNDPTISVISVNGCCYGIDNKTNKGEYFKFCGQRFWELISGDKELYKDIIEPIGYKAKLKNDEYYEKYSKLVNKFTLEFAIDFCNKDGAITWEKILELNSKAKN